jgi:hypothetical protein
MSRGMVTVFEMNLVSHSRAAVRSFSSSSAVVWSILRLLLLAAARLEAKALAMVGPAGALLKNRRSRRCIGIS